MAYEPIEERIVRMNPDGTVIRYVKGFISSTDKKPMTGIADRSELFERDTGKWFLFNEKKKQWIVPDDYEGGGLTETDKTLSVSDMAADAKTVGDRLTIVENAQPAVIQEKVDEWLEDNIAQETGYALDSTLSKANAAAPADKVGELKTSLNTEVAARQDADTALQGSLNTVCLRAAVKTISGNGTSSNTLTGLTADHVVGNWGMFSDANCTTPIPENSPPCDITITTAANTWSVTIANYSSTFYLRPTFILKQN